MQRESEIIVKRVCFLGDTQVGKSCLMTQIAEKKFLASYIATSGIDFRVSTTPLQDMQVRLQLWDTAGQERFRTLVNSYVKPDTDVIYLVYDVSNHQSFNNLPRWVESIDGLAPNAIKVLVANKQDYTDDRCVTYAEEGRQFALDNGFEYFTETSAKSGYNVEELKTWTVERLAAAQQPANAKGGQRNASISPAWQQIHANLKNFHVWRKNTDGIRWRPTGIGKMSRTLFFNKRIGDEELLRRFRAMALSRINDAGGNHRHQLTRNIYDAIVQLTKPLTEIHAGQLDRESAIKMVNEVDNAINGHVSDARSVLSL